MHGHHGDAVVAIHPAVQVGVEGDLVQKAGEAGLALHVLQIGQDAGFQLLHVLQAATALQIVLLPEGGGVAAAVTDPVVELQQVGLRQGAA